MGLSIHHLCECSSKCRKNKRGKRAHLHLSNTLFILPLLLSSKPSIQWWYLSATIWRRISIKHLNIKECLLVSTSPESSNTNIYTSFILPISSFNLRASPTRGYNRGSTLTSLHTLVRTVAVKSLNSILCGAIHGRKFMARLTLKPWPQTQLVAKPVGSQP